MLQSLQRFRMLRWYESLGLYGKDSTLAQSGHDVTASSKGNQKLLPEACSLSAMARAAEKMVG